MSSTDLVASKLFLCNSWGSHWHVFCPYSVCFPRFDVVLRFFRRRCPKSHAVRALERRVGWFFRAGLGGPDSGAFLESDQVLLDVTDENRMQNHWCVQLIWQKPGLFKTLLRCFTHVSGCSTLLFRRFKTFLRRSPRRFSTCVSLIPLRDNLWGCICLSIQFIIQNMSLNILKSFNNNIL